jgi:hypothetical protein
MPLVHHICDRSHDPRFQGMGYWDEKDTKVISESVISKEPEG